MEKLKGFILSTNLLGSVYMKQTCIFYGYDLYLFTFRRKKDLKNQRSGKHLAGKMT